MRRCVAVIPARSGSKGVLDKNIRLLAGFPVIAYSIQAAKKCKLIDEVYVSTDSQQYAEIARGFGATVPFLRPAKLAADNSPDIDFVKHFLQWYLQQNNQLPTLLIHLRPTTPVRDPVLIDTAIALAVEQQSSISSLRSVHLMPESAYKCFESVNSMLKPLFNNTASLDRLNLPRQQFPDTFHANGYVDILLPELVMQNNKLHGDKIYAFKTELTHEIDTEDEFKYLEYQLACEKNNILNKLFR